MPCVVSMLYLVTDATINRSLWGGSEWWISRQWYHIEFCVGTYMEKIVYVLLQHGGVSGQILRCIVQCMKTSWHALLWRHNERVGVSIVCSSICSGADQRKTSKLCITGRCVGNPPVTGGFPSQRASDAEYISIFPYIWRRHHGNVFLITVPFWEAITGNILCCTA